MISVKNDIDAILKCNPVKSALDAVMIYGVSPISDITKNVLRSRGIFFAEPSILSRFNRSMIVMTDEDRDWLLDTLEMIVEEE
jgi:hypothetical protein